MDVEFLVPDQLLGSQALKNLQNTVALCMVCTHTFPTILQLCTHAFVLLIINLICYSPGATAQM